MIKKYSVLGCEVTRDVIWHIHAVGCADVKRMIRKGWHETIDELDLTDEDQVMSVLDPDELGYGLQDVKIHDCTTARANAAEKRLAARAAVADAQPPTRRPGGGGQPASRRVIATKPTAPVPTTKPGKNGKAQDAGNRKGEKIIQDIIAKIVAARGADSVGEADLWEEERLPTVDDYVYDLAVEVRKKRAEGLAWWRIANDLFLPGAGPSAQNGKSGAAYARRLWERAWGKTYVDGERAPRKTIEREREKAITAVAVPYFAPGVKDEAIVATISGKTIHWTIRIAGLHGAIVSPQEAVVHADPRSIKVAIGPRGRYVEFFEAMGDVRLPKNLQWANTGPRRSVYLNNIHRVGT